MSAKYSDSPVLVGGVGGSGTRVITEILMKTGFFMGSNLNSSNDYLGYGLADTLRKLMSSQIEKTDYETIKYIHHRLGQIELEIKSDMEHSRHYHGWGWKVPGNFYLLEYANNYFPKFRYIHVIRHGLDMAFSSNQNQLKNWGMCFDVDINKLPLPIASLKYWTEANKFARSLGAKLMKKRFHLLSFDDLVMKPQKTVEELLVFLDVEYSNKDIGKLADIVHKPASLGRYKKEDISIFSKADIKEVIDFGFQV